MVLPSAVTSSDFFFFSSRRRHTRFDCDWSSDVCSSDLTNSREYVERGLPIIPLNGKVPAIRDWQEFVANKANILFHFGPEQCCNIGMRRSEERRVGKEGRSRWSPYH